MDNIKFYIYIDSDGIDSLYRQYSEREKNEKTIAKNQFGAEISSDIGTSGLLQKLVSVSAEATLDARYEVTKESENHVSYEDKISFLLNKVNNGRTRTLPEIFETTSKISTQLLLCKGLFRLVQVYDEKSNKYLTPFQVSNDPLRYTNVSFVFCTTPNLHTIPDNENILNYTMKQREVYIDMYFSGTRMVRNVRHITNNIKLGKDFIFHVLGELSSEGGNIYSLKPFAIWRETDRNI